MATEKRLIYLEDAIAKIVDTPSAIVERLSNCEYGYYQNPDMLVDRQHEIIDLLMDVPTVDAVPVVHGHWTSLTDCANAGVYCSICHKKVWKEDYAWCNKKNKLRSNYCPNCGAKMDGDANA